VSKAEKRINEIPNTRETEKRDEQRFSEGGRERASYGVTAWRNSGEQAGEKE